MGKKIVYEFQKERVNISMKKKSCVECKKYRKFVNPNVSDVLDKIVLFIVCRRCVNVESTEILKVIGLLDNIK